MPGLRPDVDPDGLLEYSVVYTDRALNHMSESFRAVMRDISGTLKRVYGADAAVVIPGSGTFAMEAVARQLANGQKCLVVRNGWFSYRWSQILEQGGIPSSTTVLTARRTGSGRQDPFAPPSVEDVVATIGRESPGVVFAPHVETSSGMILPDGYIAAIGEATRRAGGLLVLDCIASGTLWVDMRALGVDVLVTAPQKGWSGSPCCGLVMLGARALERVESTTSSSFACDLKKWLQIMRAYEGGGHAYHATMPTDALRVFRDVMRETEALGFEEVRGLQEQLGARVRAMLGGRGFRSVAEEGFGAPGVVVCYTDDEGVKTGRKFAEAGLQIAPGVPLQCDEGPDFSTFRLGLFGLDKLHDLDRTVKTLETALDQVS